MSAAIVGGRASSRLHILFFLLPLGITSQQGLIVQTDIGPVIGRQMVAANGLMVFTFQGIPYAQPPVGSERWKPAKPAHNWSEPYANATLPYKGRCAQSRDFVQIGSEDCLYLSIFTPSIEQGAQLPIIVWIHDQRSESGISGDTPETGFRDNLAARGIIAITFNYRFGPFAAFAGVEEYLGHSDQLLALEWIHRNAALFGGNASKVTLAGAGTGAEDVLSHLQSSRSAGLFAAAIMQSGQFRRRRFDVENASAKLVNNIGCTWAENQMTESMMQCLINKPTDEILRASQAIDWSARANNDGAPIASVPIMLGVTRDEWGYHDLLNLTYQSSYVRQFSRSYFMDQVSEVVANYAQLNDTVSKDLLVGTIQSIYSTNWLNSDDSRFWFAQYIRLKTEALYHAPTIELARTAAANGTPVYLYQFDHLSSAEMAQLPWKGVVHGSEIQYLFATPGRSVLSEVHFNPTPTDLQLVSSIGGLWTNFVKMGDPTPEAGSRNVQWTRLQYDNANARSSYLSIGAVSAMKTDFSPRAVEVWIDLVPAILAAVARPEIISHFVENSCNLSNKFSTFAGIGIALIIVLIFICGLLSVYICVKRNRNKGTVFITADQQQREMDPYGDTNVKTLFGSRYR